MTGFEPARVSSGKFRASIRVRPKSTPLDHSGTLSRGRRARRRRRARRGWGLRGRAVARGGARDSRPSERARRSRVRIERWIHARYVLMMIYEGETGTKDDHGDGGAAETLAARDAGSSAAAFFRAFSTPWINLAFFCESVERRARRQSSSFARGRRASDGCERRASAARTRALRWRVWDIFANACVFQMIPPARERPRVTRAMRQSMIAFGARASRRARRAPAVARDRVEVEPSGARARRTSRERAFLDRHEHERGEHGVDERVDARACVARDVARDGAGQRATVRDGVRGRQRALVQSSRGQKNAKNAYTWEFHDLLFYCGFESPRVVTVAALKLTVSFLHNVTTTSILGRVRGFRPTRASILRSARALSR